MRSRPAEVAADLFRPGPGLEHQSSVLGDFDLYRLDGPMFWALGLPLVSPLAACPTPKGSVSNRPAYASTPAAGSSSTATTGDRFGDLRGGRRGQTSARLQRHAARTRRRPTRADSSSVWRSIRPQAARYTAHSKSPASGRLKNQIRTSGIPNVVGRCDLATTPRGANAGHGGLLKLFRTDTRKLLGVHRFGGIAAEAVGLGHVVLQLGGSVELFLTLGPNTPTYSYAYHDATVDGLTRLTKLMSPADRGDTAGAAQ